MLKLSDRKHRMNFNTMELEVNTRSTKQSNKNNIGWNSEKMSLYSIGRTKKNANKTGGALLDDGDGEVLLTKPQQSSRTGKLG